MNRGILTFAKWRLTADNPDSHKKAWEFATKPARHRLVSAKWRALLGRYDCGGTPQPPLVPAGNCTALGAVQWCKPLRRKW